MIRTRASGFAAIAAVFLLVVLAALGAFMWHMGVTQQLTSTQDMQGSRAYWAARGGLEWGLTSVNAAASCPASPTALTIGSFSVTVTCTLTSFSEAGSTVKLFQLQSIAKQGTTPGAMGYVERSVSASMEK